MTTFAEVLVLAGAIAAFIGSMGLVRLPPFFERVHAPTMGTTLGTGLVLAGSMLYFGWIEGRPVLHEILIAAFMTFSTPVTSLLLGRAALQRERGGQGL
ncbi:MAG TPA: monovalent cation/H(+) antiporter subunit G [Usitatibacter sp.]|nr:monovalent cation/H(+) antiporter subunit G [Usitatibacter sp.]